MEIVDKIVKFSEYCAKCKHKDEPETDDTCNECLNNPVNEYSHKPVNYKEAENERK